MKFVLLILVPIVIAVLVGSMTNSLVWGIVSFPITMLIVNWIAVALFGRPSNEELRRITDRPVSEDLSKEELSLETRQIASRFGFKPTHNQLTSTVLVSQNSWSQEKIQFYETHFDIDVEMMKKVDQVNKHHYVEINNHWHSVEPRRKDEIFKVFSDNLAAEWPTEYSELFSTANIDILRSCAGNVQKAYLAGYMLGKGWISIDELTNANRWFAQSLLGDIVYILGTAKSRSTALAASMMKVSAYGTAASYNK